MISNFNIHGIPISLNKNVDFDVTELTEILRQLNYAFETDFDFNLIASHYQCINIMSPLTRRDVGGFYDASIIGSAEHYIKVSFYHQQRGQSSHYHIFITKENNGWRCFYKGFSKINPAFATIRNNKNTPHHINSKSY